jgi:membrane-bound metal-dependent hydrolase YbcI (DUF457 family)
VFIGHFAVGFAAKRWAPRTNLAVLMAAPLLPDLLWPVFVLLGLERATIVAGETPFLHLSLDWYPWSHSLVMDAVWAALFGGLVWRFSKDRAAGAVVAIGVLSHWLFDWITHRPDMPLWPGGPEAGLGLWYSVRGTVVVESVLFVVGVALYVAATRGKDRIGHLALWSLVALLALLYVGTVMGPPPPAIVPVVVMGIVLEAAGLAWVWWIDRHRVPASARPGA